MNKLILLLTVLSGVALTAQADVVVLQSGAVVTGNILQQDANGVLLQMEAGTYRYPLAWIKDVKKEAAAARHVSNNGQVIPDWAQIVTLLAGNSWAQGMKQVPATMIEAGNYRNVPYVSFRCGNGLYEVNIYGDLNQPAAVQIGAMDYLHQTSQEKSNCVNFLCSVLASADARKNVRALSLTEKDSQRDSGFTFTTILPGEWGSYGGWWVSACNTNALAAAQATDGEIASLTQSPSTTNVVNITNTVVVSTAATSASSTSATTTTGDSGQITSSGTYSYAGYGYGWTAEEMAAAHPPAANSAATYPTATGNKVYPRSYSRPAGGYAPARR
jgi:hypothetical protein